MFFLGGGDNRFIYASEFRDPPPQPWKAAKGKKGKATMAAAKKGAKRKRSADDAKPRHSDGKPKPASWLKARPHGCGKCRYIPGCTRSCYLIRGEKVPK